MAQIPPYVANVKNDISNWVLQQPYLTRAPRLHGGWERWAQGDMCLYMQQLGRNAQCEVECFVADRACDIGIEYNAQPPYAVHWELTELKAWKQFSEDLNTFFGEVASDVTKFARNNLAPYYQSGTVRKWVIGLSTERGIREMYESNQQPIPNVIAWLDNHYPAGVYTDAAGQQHTIDFTHEAIGQSGIIITSCLAP